VGFFVLFNVPKTKGVECAHEQVEQNAEESDACRLLCLRDWSVPLDQAALPLVRKDVA